MEGAAGRHVLSLGRLPVDSGVHFASASKPEDTPRLSRSPDPFEGSENFERTCLYIELHIALLHFITEDSL